MSKTVAPPKDKDKKKTKGGKEDKQIDESVSLNLLHSEF